jgi:uncharacterized protein YciI
MNVKYVLFYEPGANAAEMAAAARVHFPAHAARWAEFGEAGTLLLIGPFTDGSGAMAVFSTREAAELFAKDDPFVTQGVVSGWSIREWNEALFQP